MNDAHDSVQDEQIAALRRGRISTDIVSLCATIVAVIALVTAIYQAKLMRDQAKAVVWPYLIQGNSGNGGYSRIIQNVGVGPAIIRAFEVRVDGKIVHTWSEAFDSLHIRPSRRGEVSTSFRAGLVVPTNTTIELIALPDSSDIRLVRSRVEHLDTWVCYCSLYGDCWGESATDTEPVPVKACAQKPERRFLD